MDRIICAPKPVKKKIYHINKENIVQGGVSTISVSNLNNKCEYDSLILEKNILKPKNNFFNNKGGLACGSLSNDISIEEDFIAFKENIKKEVQDKSAKDEISSILSFNNNNSIHFKSSIPPLRPTNPLTKNILILDENFNNEYEQHSHLAIKRDSIIFVNTPSKYLPLSSVQSNNKEDLKDSSLMNTNENK